MSRFAVVLVAAIAGAGCSASTSSPPARAANDDAESQSADAPEAKVAPRREQPPLGAGGLRFGSDTDQARAACLSGGNRWADDEGGLACVAPEGEDGLATVQFLDFCSGALCGVHVTAFPMFDESERWLATYAYLGEQLERRYGAPDDRASRVPGECSQTLVDCLKQRRAGATARWRWPDGHAVLLRMAGNGDAPPTISVSYTTPEATKAMSSGTR